LGFNVHALAKAGCVPTEWLIFGVASAFEGAERLFPESGGEQHPAASRFTASAG